MKRIFCSLILLAAATSTKAQEKSDTAAMEPVEVRAVRVNATAPFAKTNLSKKDIQKQNLGQDLPFLLNATPSVVINSDAGNGIGYTGIRIRGTDATRINMTINGIPYNDAESQGLFFVNLPDLASSVNSIQIQRGVGTSTNGAGAFGATINLSTNEVNRESYLELNNSFGSFNTWKHTVKAGTGLLNEHFTADLRLSRITSDGWVDRARTDLSSFYFSTAYLNRGTSLRFNIIGGKERTYQAWNGIPEADLKKNRRANYSGTEKTGTPYENETDNYWQDHYQLFFNQQLTPNLVLSNALFLVKGRGYYEQYKADEAYADYGLPAMGAGGTITNSDLIRQLWLRNNYYGNVLSLQYDRNATRIQFGTTITQYDGDHFGEVIWAQGGLNNPKERWYDLPATKRDWSSYAKWQQTITGGLQSFVDLQYRTVHYSINGFRNNPALNLDNRFHFFNPKIGLSYYKADWLLYTSFSMAAKEPNRDDFEAGLQQQPRPEKLRDLEAGVEYKKTRWNASANLYYMNYRDQLILTGRINDVGAYTRTNIEKSYRLGVELQAGSFITPWMQAAANLTLSRNRIDDFTEFVDDYDNGGQVAKTYKSTDIAFSPSVVGAATVSIKPVKKLTVDLLGKYVGRQFLDNTGNAARSLDAYYNQDLRATYAFSIRRIKGIELIAQVNNLFNAQYEANGYTFSYIYGGDLATENYYFPMAGTNVLVGINVRL